MIYLDTSALIRMLDARHPSHGPLLDYLDDGDRWSLLATSALTAVEAARVAVRERNPEIRKRADEFLGAIMMVPITAEIIAGARDIKTHVKALDAIHLSTAADVRATELLGYDATMQSVWSSELGGSAVSP